MKKQSILLAMLVFGLVLGGCSTTRSITFAENTQPDRDYKYVVINVTNLFGSASVLQRFYEQYPASQYEVVAYEKTVKTWLLVTAGAGGALLGGALTVIISPGDDLVERIWLPVSVFAAIGASGGFIWHQISGNSYVITYVERQGVVPLSTQG